MTDKAQLNPALPFYYSKYLNDMVKSGTIFHSIPHLKTQYQKKKEKLDQVLLKTDNI